MRYAFTLDGRTHHVVLEEHAAGPRFLVGGTAFQPSVEALGEGRYKVVVDDHDFEFQVHAGRIEWGPRPLHVQIRRAKPQVIRAAGRGRAADGKVRPPMPGKIVEVLVQVGETVSEGDVLVVLEAMKMQNDIKSPLAGTVAKVHVQPGSNVEATTVLVEVEPAAE